MLGLLLDFRERERQTDRKTDGDRNREMPSIPGTLGDTGVYKYKTEKQTETETDKQTETERCPPFQVHSMTQVCTSIRPKNNLRTSGGECMCMCFCVSALGMCVEWRAH